MVYKLDVTNLSSNTTSDSLYEAFAHYGDIDKAVVVDDLKTGKSRGFGFLRFSDEQSMKNALEGMNEHELDGRIIVVKVAASEAGSSEKE